LAEKSTSPLPTSWRFILALWIPVWVFFLVWPLRKDPARLANAFRLIRADNEARRANVYGEEFHAFLRFCKDRLPVGSTFRLVGIDSPFLVQISAPPPTIVWPAAAGRHYDKAAFDQLGRRGEAHGVAPATEIDLVCCSASRADQ